MVRRRAMAFCLVVVLVAPRAYASGIDTIRAYAGTWATHTVHYKTQYSRARTETAILRNVCWRSAGYFTCDQFVQGSSKALIVFTYDRSRRMYHTYTVPTNGGAAGSGMLVIAGNTWIYPWEDKDGLKKVHLRVVNTFVNPDTIQYRQEFSYDNVHWTTTATGSETRLTH